MTKKTAFIAIVGCPNAGKSSILNRLLGQKVSIVSPKPQTTRVGITGVLTSDDGIQLVFTDTPGFNRPRSKLDSHMQHAVNEGIKDVDACVLVTEPQGAVRKEELALMDRFREHDVPALLCINKVDLLEDKDPLLARIAEFSKLYPFRAVIPVSAKTGDNFDALLDELKLLAVPSEHFYPDDALTNLTERQIAADMIREKLLLHLDKEVPHGIAVSIETFKERDSGDITDISAVIYCEKESHKGIIIGRGGSMLKAVASDARRDMEKNFDRKIDLKVFVKVREGWRDDENAIRSFGLDGSNGQG